MQTTSMEYDWFMITASWDVGADAQAVERFTEVYEYLNVLTKDNWREALGSGDARLELNSQTIRALNLIGQRTFVIICQAASNRVLQELSKMISLGAPVEVDIFPATTVQQLKNVLPKEVP